MVLLLALTGLFCSCTQVEDARHVVAEADSLRAVGMAYDDSLSIAEAAATLFHVRNLYPTDYAHANYYYGRLLRNRGDQPAAMLAFLNVIHSRTEDHAIKGRSYSNIGTMCRLATEHELASQIYQQSAQQFLLALDTAAYCYALNNIAVDLAEMHKKEEALLVLSSAPEDFKNSHPDVLMKTLETLGIVYTLSRQYDSTIYYVTKLQKMHYNEPAGYLNKAQAFSFLGHSDSAIVYAQKVMAFTQCTLNEKYNALYILSNNDPFLTNEEILQLTSLRADIGKMQEKRQGELSQAVQLLEQDINRKPNMAWLWATLVTLLIIGVPSSVYISRKRKKHQLYSQKTIAAREEHRVLSEQNQQLEQQQNQRREEVMAEIDVFCNSITEENIKQKLCWRDFDQMCTIVNQRMFGFIDKLNAQGITSMTEIRICVLLALGSFDAKQMANLVPCTYDSFKTTKSVAAKKLKISGRNMRPALLKLAIY